jgi:hypothetical protein
MKAARIPSYLAMLVGSVQMVCGVAVWSWAWPLFADPPFLRNGLIREYSILRTLLKNEAVAAEPLSALHQKLEYLFARQNEGILLGLASGACLIFCGFVLLVFGIWTRKQMKKLQ